MWKLIFLVFCWERRTRFVLSVAHKTSHKVSKSESTSTHLVDQSPNHHQPAVTGWSREITINPYYLSFLSIARTRLKREGRIDRSWRYHSQPPRNNFSNYSLVRYPPEAQVEFLLLPRNNVNQLFERGEIARHEQDHGQAGERNDADAN